MNVRGLPSSVYRGEGVGAPSSDINAELVSKAVQGLNVNEGIIQHFVLFTIFILLMVKSS